MKSDPAVVPAGPAPQSNAFRIEQHGDRALVWFDLPGQKVNKFSTPVMEEFSALVDFLGRSAGIGSVIFASSKPSTFIAGADVAEFVRTTSADQVRAYVRLGQQVFQRLAGLPQVTVAAIDGACLGGGLEMAISCDWRVMSDSPKAVMGVPEVKLGIFPAWGGATKLPRLVGLPAALDLILTGKTVDGRKARRLGLVDEVVSPSILLEVAARFADRGKSSDRGRTHFYLEGNPLARRLIFAKARRSVLAQTHGHYPAPLKAMEVMESGLSSGVERGLEREAEEVAPLILGQTAQNLVRLFFLTEESKKDRVAAAPRSIETVGVLGAGVMGGGIAQIVADKTEAVVRMRDVNWKALSGGMQAAARVWRKKLQRRRITRAEMQRKLARITATTDWSGFPRADLVIEAVIENLDIKRRVLAEFEELSRPEAIFASNTSTIPIAEIAHQARRPENVVGLHFFNPVDRMPLVEVIRGSKTSDQAAVTAAVFARRLGKTVVYCNDGPGFIVNRVLGPYLNEAGFLLEEGNSIESIDQAMLDFGMPMGPLALLDEVGIDVAAKVGDILSIAFPSRMGQRSKPVDILNQDGRYGRKNGRGLYRYDGARRRGPDPDVYRLLGLQPHRAEPEEVVDRTILPMVNEAVTILDQRIAGSAGELDLAMIMGTGFPPFRGGLLRYADSLGAQSVAARLQALASRLGSRFEPVESLRRLAAGGRSFYETYPRA